MDRSEKLIQIAAVCRRDHRASLALVGWWAAAAPESELDAVLALMEGLEDAPASGSHYEAYRERWGRIPG